MDTTRKYRQSYTEWVSNSCQKKRSEIEGELYMKPDMDEMIVL